MEQMMNERAVQSVHSVYAMEREKNGQAIEEWLQNALIFPWKSNFGHKK